MEMHLEKYSVETTVIACQHHLCRWHVLAFLSSVLLSTLSSSFCFMSGHNLLHFLFLSHPLQPFPACPGATSPSLFFSLWLQPRRWLNHFISFMGNPSLKTYIKLISLFFFLFSYNFTFSIWLHYNKWEMEEFSQMFYMPLPELFPHKQQSH